MLFDKNSYYEYLNNSDYNTALELACFPQYKTFINGAVTDVYSYSNENLRQLFANLNVKNKSVATVGSSGDQALNAIYYGADKVTIIDACITAEPYIELKKAAILNFDFKTFNNFMTSENLFNPIWYAKISHDLNNTAKMFWDNMYLDGCIPSIETLMCLKENARQRLGSAFYDNKDNYQRLQQLLRGKNFEYIQAELSDFPQKLKDKYDLILLSNVYDYVDHYAFYNVVKELEKNNLNNGGVMQLHYLFGLFDCLEDAHAKVLSTCLDKKVETLFVQKTYKPNFTRFNRTNTVNDADITDKVLIKDESGLFSKSELQSTREYAQHILMEK